MGASTKPLIIGVAGSSCSGKTTLEAGLQRTFGDQLALVSFDDFFVGLSALPGRRVDNWESPSLYRWDEYARTLNALASGAVARFEPHSNEAKRDGVTERVVTPRPLIVVAGFLALYSPEINEHIDVKVFIDLPEEEMIRRRLARAALRAPGPWDSQEYIQGALVPGTREFVNPQRDVADYVVDGMRSQADITGTVAAIIKSHR